MVRVSRDVFWRLTPPPPFAVSFSASTPRPTSAERSLSRFASLRSIVATTLVRHAREHDAVTGRPRESSALSLTGFALAVRRSAAGAARPWVGGAGVAVAVA